MSHINNSERTTVSLQQHGSAASSPACDFCGEPATKQVRRINTSKLWRACDHCIEKRRLKFWPYQETMLSNVRLTDGEHPKQTTR